MDRAASAAADGPAWHSPGPGRWPRRPRLTARGVGPAAAPRPRCAWPHAEDEPGRPARCQGLIHRLHHVWQGPPRAALPRREPLRLTQPAGIGRHEPITPRVALLLELAKEPHRDIAARIPALQERRCIGVEQTVAVVAAAFAPRKGDALEIALDGAQPHPHVLRNGRGCPPLTVPGPDLRMQGLPAGLALRRALLRQQGDGVFLG
jgi:hypothetical protein